MDYYERATGAQRNFRRPGARLLPRDSYDAMRSIQYKLNARQRKVEDAKEVAAYGPLFSEDGMASSTERKVFRARQALSARRAKQVERRWDHMRDAADPEVVRVFPECDGLGAAQTRYFRALENDFCAAMAEQADAYLLRCALG